MFRPKGEVRYNATSKLAISQINVCLEYTDKNIICYHLFFNISESVTDVFKTKKLMFRPES